MTQVEKISVIKSAGIYEYSGSVVNVTEVTSNGRYRGTCTLPSGKEFSFSNSASGLQARIANNGVNPSGKTSVGKETAANILTKIDNSQAHGTHKIVAVSDNKLARQHRVIMKALSDINKVLGYQDEANNLIQAAWFEYSSNQQAIAEAIAKAKAEAEARAKAEAEAKAEAARVEAQRQMIELASKNAGISIEEAEKNLRALGMIK